MIYQESKHQEQRSSSLTLLVRVIFWLSSNNDIQIYFVVNENLKKYFCILLFKGFLILNKFNDFLLLHFLHNCESYEQVFLSNRKFSLRAKFSTICNVLIQTRDIHKCFETSLNYKRSQNCSSHKDHGIFQNGIVV